VDESDFVRDADPVLTYAKKVVEFESEIPKKMEEEPERYGTQTQVDKKMVFLVNEYTDAKNEEAPRKNYKPCPWRGLTPPWTPEFKDEVEEIRARVPDAYKQGYPKAADYTWDK